MTTINVTTPKGVLVYPHLNKADTKFDTHGVWRANLRLTAEDAQSLKQSIDDAIEANADEYTKSKGKKVKIANPPYQEDEDGNYVFTFKLKASGTRPNGERWEQKPILYDAKGNVFQANGKTIWGGTKAKVAFQMSPYFVSSIGAGVSLRLKAVQIIELVTGGADASSYGFQEEEGFVAENETKEETPEEGDF